MDELQRLGEIEMLKSIQDIAPVLHARKAVAVEPSWAQQTEAGRRKATDLLTLMRAGSNPTLLGRAMEAMISKGEYGGEETGFCSAIALAAMGAGPDGNSNL